MQKSVVRLVLALVEFLRKLLERQAIRRMESGTLTAEETERIGEALSPPRSLRCGWLALQSVIAA